MKLDLTVTGATCKRYYRRRLRNGTEAEYWRYGKLKMRVLKLSPMYVTPSLLRGSKPFLARLVQSPEREEVDTADIYWNNTALFDHFFKPESEEVK